MRTEPFDPAGISELESRGDHPAMAEALAAAVTAAGHAPSIHNTQPWRWRLAGARLDLYLDRSRLLDVTDPDARLATLSCGAALHHVRVSVAAAGWHATVARMPDEADPSHLAHLRLDGPAPIDADAVQHAQAIARRHSDRRPLTGEPARRADLAAVTSAITAEHAQLHVLRPEQVFDLAAAANRAQRAEATDTAWQAEMAYWTGGTRPSGAGVPDDTIPDAATETTVPTRDFGHHGDLVTGAAHDEPARFAVLFGPGDEPADWLRAGEALSAGWLTATALGVAVLPLSATVELAATREIIRALIANLGHPYLVLRIGSIDPEEPAPPHSPRLPAEQIIERSPQ